MVVLTTFLGSAGLVTLARRELLARIGAMVSPRLWAAGATQDVHAAVPGSRPTRRQPEDIDCAVSFNTADHNAFVGLDGETGSLVTHNTAMDNGTDFVIRCPTYLSFNTSSGGADSYLLIPIEGPCRLVHND